MRRHAVIYYSMELSILLTTRRGMFALQLLRKCTHLMMCTYYIPVLFGRISGQLFTRVINQSCTYTAVVVPFLFFPSLISCFAFALTVPDGKPQVTSAHNSSSTSIYLNWKPPPKSSIHGEFLGYRLAYKPRDDTSPESVQEIFLRDPSIEVCALFSILTAVEPYS